MSKALKLFNVGFALLFLSIFLVLVGSFVPHYGLYIVSTGFGLGIIGFYMTRFLRKNEEQQFEVAFDAWRKKMLAEGIRIEVDLAQVEIKSSSYREEKGKDGWYANSQYAALDELSGQDQREYTQVNQCLLVYSTEYKGRKKKFTSPVIFKDRNMLLFLMANKKTTHIYVSPADDEQYFFDVDFIYQ